MSAPMDSNLLQQLGLKHPLIVAPMAGGPSSVELVAAASAAGVLGAMGGAYLNAAAIEAFAAHVRQRTDRPFSINLFIPHSIPEVATDRVERAAAATARYRRELELPSPQLVPPYEEDFDAQFEAVLRIKPACFSFVFGLLPADYVREAKKAGIPLIGTATNSTRRGRWKRAASMRSCCKASKRAVIAAFSMRGQQTRKSGCAIFWCNASAPFVCR